MWGFSKFHMLCELFQLKHVYSNKCQLFTGYRMFLVRGPQLHWNLVQALRNLCKILKSHCNLKSHPKSYKSWYFRNLTDTKGSTLSRAVIRGQARDWATSLETWLYCFQLSFDDKVSPAKISGNPGGDLQLAIGGQLGLKLSSSGKLVRPDTLFI